MQIEMMTPEAADSALAQPVHLLANVGEVMCVTHRCPEQTFRYVAYAAEARETVPHTACMECCIAAALAWPKAGLAYFAHLLRSGMSSRQLDAFVDMLAEDDHVLTEDQRILACVFFVARMQGVYVERMIGDLLDYKGVRLQ